MVAWVTTYCLRGSYSDQLLSIVDKSDHFEKVLATVQSFRNYVRPFSFRFVLPHSPQVYLTPFLRVFYVKSGIYTKLDVF